MQSSACQICSKQENLSRCSGCKSVQYCSISCQKVDWKTHKIICQEIQLKLKRELEKKQRKEKGLRAIEDFADFELIGTGNFSEILRVREIETNQLFALKRMCKRKLQQVNKEKDVYMEKHCLQKLLDNKYVVRMHSTFQDDENLYMLLEYIPGGELWNQVHTYGVGVNSLIKYYLSLIVKAIQSIHQVGIAHRDIKTENIILTEDNQIKFIDFGTARDMFDQTIEGSGNGRKGKMQFKHFVGTPQYMAPECIRNRDSNFKSDIYSLGVLFYQICFGKYPFDGGSEYLVFQAALETPLQFPDHWIIDDTLKKLIVKMMEKDPQLRFDLDEVMKDEYWQLDWDKLPSYDQVINSLDETDKWTFDFLKQLRQVDKLEDISWKKLEIQNILQKVQKEQQDEEKQKRFIYIQQLAQKYVESIQRDEQQQE